MNSTPQCILKLKQFYPQFSGNYKAIADHILENPETFIQGKIKDISRSCNCDDAQVVRFCKKLGYSGFSELKSSFAADFIPLKLNINVREAASGGNFAQVKHDFLDNNLRVMNDTVALFDEAGFGRAVEWIRGAKRISLCGAGSSGMVAGDLQIKLLRLGYNAFHLADPEMNRMFGGLLEPEDLLIAFSFSGENELVKACAAEAKRRGVKVIGITNFPHSSIGGLCDLNLLTASDENTFRLGAMSSRIAQLLVVDFLALQLALCDLPRAEENVIRTHQSIHP